MTTTIAIQIIVRAALQAACGYLVAKGYAKQGAFNVDELAGALVFAGTVAWSFYSKKQLLNKNTTPSQDA